MQASELTALLKTTKVFAISATPIQSEIPWQHKPEKSRYGRPVRSCPVGLIRATVIDTNAEWTEVKAFGCLPGSETHEVKRKAGVLVEFDAPGPEDGFDYDKAAKTRHVELIPDPKDEGLVKKVRMIVAKKAIIMPWKDYKPVYDTRRKSARDAAARNERCRNAERAVAAAHTDWNGERPKDKNGETDYDAPFVYDEKKARVNVPLLVVEKIAVLRTVLEDSRGKNDQGAWNVTGAVVDLFDLVDEIAAAAESNGAKRVA